MSDTIKVFLADDDADFRRVYRRLFERSDGFQVMDEAGTGQEAIRKINGLRPDVALVDIQMPDGSGLDVVRGVAESPTRVIILTTFDLDEYIAEAMQHGSAGFLLKNASSAEILSAVRAVHAGGGSLAPEVTARLMGQFSERPLSVPHAFTKVRLSERELQSLGSSRRERRTNRSPTNCFSPSPRSGPTCGVSSSSWISTIAPTSRFSRTRLACSTASADCYSPRRANVGFREVLAIVQLSIFG